MKGLDSLPQPATPVVLPTLRLAAMISSNLQGRAKAPKLMAAAVASWQPNSSESLEVQVAGVGEGGYHAYETMSSPPPPMVGTRPLAPG